MRQSPVRRSGILALIAIVLCAVVAMQALAGWSKARLGAVVAAEARPGDIQMIGSVTCVYCAQARAWFHANKVPFSECEIERDARCAAAYNALMSPGTPVLVVRGKRLVGFSAQSVADALKASASAPV